MILISACKRLRYNKYKNPKSITIKEIQSTEMYLLRKTNRNYLIKLNNKILELNKELKLQKHDTKGKL